MGEPRSISVGKLLPMMDLQHADAFAAQNLPIVLSTRFTYAFC